MVKKRGGSGKSSKNPPAKTTYDVIWGSLNAVVAKKGGFWCFSGFLETSGLCP